MIIITLHYGQVYQILYVNMGQQHNTHVANGTGESIQVEIKHDGVCSKKFLEKGEVVCEPTGKCWVTITVNGEQGESRGIESDYSVVIKKTSEGLFKIRRAKYGTIWQEIDDVMGAK